MGIAPPSDHDEPILSQEDPALGNDFATQVPQSTQPASKQRPGGHFADLLALAESKKARSDQQSIKPRPAPIQPAKEPTAQSISKSSTQSTVQLAPPKSTPPPAKGSVAEKLLERNAKLGQKRFNLQRGDPSYIPADQLSILDKMPWFKKPRTEPLLPVTDLEQFIEAVQQCYLRYRQGDDDALLDVQTTQQQLQKLQKILRAARPDPHANKSHVQQLLPTDDRPTTPPKWQEIDRNITRRLSDDDSGNETERYSWEGSSPASHRAGPNTTNTRRRSNGSHTASRQFAGGHDVGRFKYDRDGLPPDSSAATSFSKQTSDISDQGTPHDQPSTRPLFDSQKPLPLELHAYLKESSDLEKTTPRLGTTPKTRVFGARPSRHTSDSGQQDAIAAARPAQEKLNDLPHRPSPTKRQAHMTAITTTTSPSTSKARASQETQLGRRDDSRGYSPTPTTSQSASPMTTTSSGQIPDSTPPTSRKLATQRKDRKEAEVVGQRAAIEIELLPSGSTSPTSPHDHSELPLPDDSSGPSSPVTVEKHGRKSSAFIPPSSPPGPLVPVSSNVTRKLQHENDNGMESSTQMVANSTATPHPDLRFASGLKGRSLHDSSPLRSAKRQKMEDLQRMAPSPAFTKSLSDKALDEQNARDHPSSIAQLSQKVSMVPKQASSRKPPSASDIARLISQDSHSPARSLGSTQRDKTIDRSSPTPAKTMGTTKSITARKSKGHLDPIESHSPAGPTSTPSARFLPWPRRTPSSSSPNPTTKLSFENIQSSAQPPTSHIKKPPTKQPKGPLRKGKEIQKWYEDPHTPLKDFARSYATLKSLKGSEMGKVVEGGGGKNRSNVLRQRDEKVDVLGWRL